MRVRRCPRTTVPARLIGMLSAGYGLAIAARPEMLTRPCELTAPGEQVPRGLRAVVALLGLRDTASGLAMAAAPSPGALATAARIRVASDLGDATVLGVVLPSPRARRKAAAVAGTWAVLAALAQAIAERG